MPCFLAEEKGVTALSPLAVRPLNSSTARTSLQRYYFSRGIVLAPRTRLVPANLRVSIPRSRLPLAALPLTIHDSTRLSKRVPISIIPSLTLPLFSYSYAPFSSAQNAVLNPFNTFHTLCARRPVGTTLRWPSFRGQGPKAPTLEEGIHFSRFTPNFESAQSGSESDWAAGAPATETRTGWGR